MKSTLNSASTILITVLFFSTVFLSCSIEKRHYRSGYYFGNGRNNSTSVRSDESKEFVEAVVADHSRASAADTALHDTLCSTGATPEQRIVPASPTKRSFKKSASGILPSSIKFSPVFKKSPSPIEPNKELGMWFGVMAALFFIGGMLTLIAFGIGGPLVFVTALFFTCAILCVIFASLYYPKTKPEPGGSEEGAPSAEARGVARLGALFLAAVFLCVVGFAAILILSFY